MVEKVLRVLRVLKFDGALARGLWYRRFAAMIIKSALRDSLPALRVILNEVKNRRSTNKKESPLMGRLRANFGRLAHSMQNARSTCRC